MKKFSFFKGNAKLGKHITTFALPAGYSCPAAVNCLTWANRKTGKIKDGSLQSFRCFSASQEAYSTTARNSRWGNFTKARDLLKEGTPELTKHLLADLPQKATLVRIHISGDFFSQEYFDAWVAVANKRPSVTFYAYTKAINFWEQRLATIPKNLILTASLGGAWDSLAIKLNLPTAEVIFHPDNTIKPIDHDDSHAYNGKGENFALLIHGGQKKGGNAIKALKRLKAEGIEFSYSKSKKAA